MQALPQACHKHGYCVHAGVCSTCVGEAAYADSTRVSWVPEARRAGALATVYAGYSLGTVAGLLLTPALAAAFQWPAALHAFSLAGLAWAVGAHQLLGECSVSCCLYEMCLKLMLAH